MVCLCGDNYLFQMSYFRLAVRSALFSRITVIASPLPVRCIFTSRFNQLQLLMKGKTMYPISLSSGHASLVCSSGDVVSVRRLAMKTVKSSYNAQVPGLAATASRDVTVYTYENSRYFMFLTIFGAFFFVFFANIGHLFITVPLSQLHQKKSDASSDSVIMQILMWLSQDHIKIRIGIACLSLGEH
jgi:TMEM70/TMEM186/TMEM223 protein family